MRAAWALLLCAAIAGAAEVRGKVTQVVADAIYVDIGSSQGLEPGNGGQVQRVGERIADVAVVTVSGEQARLRVVRTVRRPVVGDDVVFQIKSTPQTKAETESKRPPADQPFEPLLERQKRRAKVVPERNIFHGRVSFSQVVQSDNEGDLDYAISLLTSDGMLDRIAGSRWSMRWAGNAFYRTGEAFEGSEFEGGQLIVFDLALAHPVGEDGSFRFGRFLPRTLASAGYFDGADIDVAVGENTRFGAALGFRPTRIDLTPSVDEPTGLVYGAYKVGKRGDAFASGSYGLLASSWEGDFDRAALLIEQVAELGSARLDATATIDFDVGSSEYRSGTQLTQLDAFFSWRITRGITLRAGADRWQRLDTAAERDTIEFLDPLLFENGFWRTWIGAAFALPGRLRLDLQYDNINSDTGPTTTPWRVTLEHFDPFGIPGANLSLTVFSLESFTGSGYGGLFNTSVPFVGGKWVLRALAGFRYLDEADQTFDVTNVSVNVDYLAGGGWQISGGVQWFGGTALDSLLFEFRLDYRF